MGSLSRLERPCATLTAGWPHASFDDLQRANVRRLPVDPIGLPSLSAQSVPHPSIPVGVGSKGSRSRVQQSRNSSHHTRSGDSAQRRAGAVAWARFGLDASFWAMRACRPGCLRCDTAGCRAGGCGGAVVRSPQDATPAACVRRRDRRHAARSDATLSLRFRVPAAPPATPCHALCHAMLCHALPCHAFCSTKRRSPQETERIHSCQKLVPQARQGARAAQPRQARQLRQARPPTLGTLHASRA